MGSKTYSIYWNRKINTIEVCEDGEFNINNYDQHHGAPKSGSINIASALTSKQMNSLRSEYNKKPHIIDEEDAFDVFDTWRDKSRMTQQGFMAIKWGFIHIWREIIKRMA